MDSEPVAASMDIDVFNAPLTDAWLSRVTTPMDDDDESGSYPFQVFALGQYLRGKSDIQSTAAALFSPPPGFTVIPSQPCENVPSEVRFRVAILVEIALAELSADYTPALIELLRELIVAGGDTFSGYEFQTDFIRSWGEAWQQDFWRDGLVEMRERDEDLPLRDLRRAAFLHRTHIEASCAMIDGSKKNSMGEAEVDPSLFGIVSLSDGYEVLSEALERDKGVLLDFEIPAAAVWIRVAGRKFVQAAKEGHQNWALEREGRLWPPGPMSVERWHFWLSRLEEFSKKDLGPDSSTIMQDCLQHAKELLPPITE